MICRVCLSHVKKSAVICTECSIIAHYRCAIDAPPTCDLRAQLLLFAARGEKPDQQIVGLTPDLMFDERSGPAVLCPQLENIFRDSSLYKKLLQCREMQAQKLLDLFQMVGALLPLSDGFH